MPQYHHSCKNCKFLGEFETFDLYYCPQPGLQPTVLARYGNHESAYLSGIFAPILPLIEAKKRAIAAGLLFSH